MSKQLMNRRSNGWTFVFKFKVSNGDRSIEALKVVSAPKWGPSFLAVLFFLGSFGVYYAYHHPVTGTAVAASMGNPSPDQTAVMKEIEDAQIKRDYEAMLREMDARENEAIHGGTDVITPLNVRDPSSLVMGPGL